MRYKVTEKETNKLPWTHLLKKKCFENNRIEAKKRRMEIARERDR